MTLGNIVKLFDGTIDRIVVIAECPMPEYGISNGQFRSFYVSTLPLDMLSFKVTAIGCANGLFTFNLVRE